MTIHSPSLLYFAYSIFEQSSLTDLHSLSYYLQLLYNIFNAGFNMVVPGLHQGS